MQILSTKKKKKKKKTCKVSDIVPAAIYKMNQQKCNDLKLKVF